MKKNKMWIAVCLLACFFQTVGAQTATVEPTLSVKTVVPKAKDCFRAMPDSLLPLLTAVNRADCIDFLESKMKAEVTNRFGKKSEMTALTDNFISLQLTAQSTWQMKLLAVSDSTYVVCTVSTVMAPAADSHIAFYTPDWKPLSTTVHLAAWPKADDFFIAPSDSSLTHEYEQVRRLTDLSLVKAELNAETSILTFQYATTDYVEKEVSKRLVPYLKPQIAYYWKEGCFQPMGE